MRGRDTQPVLELSQADLELICDALRVADWTVNLAPTAIMSGKRVPSEDAMAAARNVASDAEAIRDLTARIEQHVLDLPVEYELAGAKP